MKQLITLVFLTASLLASAQTWSKIDTFPGVPRSGAISFVINGKAYVGFGASKLDDFLFDLYEFDPATNKWTKKADFPGEVRQSPIAFAIGSKGYVGLGHQAFSGPYYKDFWSYTPATDTWEKVADYPGIGRRGAASFVVGQNAYVGSGVGVGIAPYKDYYRYNATQNTWTLVGNAPFTYFSYGLSFSIGTKGYVAGGEGDFSESLGEVWEFNSANNTWTKKIPSNLSDFNFVDGTAFVLNNTAYLCYGSDAKYITKYTASNNQFVNLGDAVPWGKIRYRPTSFVLGNKAYLGLGVEDLGSSPKYKNDLWVFDPTSATHDVQQNLNLAQLSPSIGSGNFYLKMEQQMAGKNCDLTLFSAASSQIFQFLNLKDGQSVDLSTASNGIWWTRFTIDNQSFFQKIVIQH